MSDLLEDCPICKKIKEGKTKEEGKYCYLLALGKYKVAALKIHEGDALPEALSDAFKLLKYNTDKNEFMVEYTEAPGHWAVMSVRTKGLPEGKSEVRSE
jgi:hypothetical protein